MGRPFDPGGTDPASAHDDDSPAPSHVTDDSDMAWLLAEVAAAPACLIDEPRLAPGTIVDDSYRIEHPLGRGGMGQVYGAFDLELGRKVAIKLHIAADPRHAQRLLREAQTMAQLGHPNVITVHEVGRFRDHVFVVMELAAQGSARAWLSKQRRPPAEILELYRQAGRGLAAAHRADLVHRDFKPDNVLVHEDGRVCVADFGLVRIDPSSDLARSSPRDSPAAGSDGTHPSGDPAVSRLTAAGATMGTPAYMAPEQMLGMTLDARADQFAFCLALFEALHGRSPFAGMRGDARRRAIEAHALQSFPRPRGVSRRVDAAIRRGLRYAVHERFPDMDALLDGLSPPRRTRLPLVVGLGTAAVTVAGITWWALPAAVDCVPTEQRVQSLWSTTHQQQLHDAILASNTPHAAGTWTRARGEIDAYLRQWAEVHDHACSQPETPVRTGAEQRACLDETLAHVEQALDLLAEVDEATADGTMSALYALPPLIECSDPERLDERARLRARPEQRQAVTALREGFARARALDNAGKSDAALSQAETLAQRAHDLGHRPSNAEALLLLGRMRSARGASSTSTIETLTNAYWEAEAAGMDAVRAEAASQLVYFVGLGQGRYDEAMTWARHGRAVVEHLGARGAAEGGSLYDSLGMLHEQRGQLDDAEANLRRAIELKTLAYGQHHPGTSSSRLNLAKVLGQRGEFEEAEALIREVHQTHTERFGPKHPNVIRVLVELGRILEQRGRDADALDAYEQVLAHWEASRGTQHPRLILVLTAIGRVENRNGRHDRALVAYRRARSIAETEWGAEHLQTAWAVLNEGEVYLASGQLSLALDRFERALRSVRAEPDHAAVVEVEFLTCLAEAWLALGNIAPARAEAQAAWNACEAEGCSPTLRSRSAFVLARALSHHRHDERAHRLAQRALEDLPAADHSHRQRRDAIERWLETHATTVAAAPPSTRD